ncbi:MAG: biopolymer transporter ExbD [Planctomycetes bacterium]|nr:biopolymer transporter ExbD [Planctomycetota bacterium]
MRVPHRPLQTLGLNMTPMIDVVFQLIIFFLLSNHLAQQESHLVLDLPAALSGREAEINSAPRVTISVLADGQILLGTRPTPVEELASRLEFERKRAGKDLEVRIRADRSVPYQAVEPILLACADAGVWNVTFAVYKKATPARP